MPQAPEWEFHYRWSEVAADGLVAAVDRLEARDVELEEKLRLGYGESCAVDFQYQYRWPQIIERPLHEQIIMLESRDTALELAINQEGGCRIELPYRWDQILPGMLEGDLWAFSCAEENDRTIELRFASCTCGKPVADSSLYLFGSRTQVSMTSTSYVMDETGSNFHFTQGAVVATSGGPSTLKFQAFIGGVWVDKYSTTVSAGAYQLLNGVTFAGTIAAGTPVRYVMTGAIGYAEAGAGTIQLSWEGDELEINATVYWEHDGQAGWIDTSEAPNSDVTPIVSPDPLNYEAGYAPSGGISNGRFYAASVDGRRPGGAPTTVEFQHYTGGVWATLATATIGTSSDPFYEVVSLSGDVAAFDPIRFRVPNSVDLAMYFGHLMVTYDENEKVNLSTWGAE